MALTQNERNKKYNLKFKRNDVKIPIEKFEQYNQIIKNNGYNSINDFVNIILRASSIVNDIIPDRADLIDIIDNDKKNQ